jgi:hypothetical protein
MPKGGSIVSVAGTIQKALDENPEIRIVLDIAARARDTEAKEPPREIGASTEVAAQPTHTQCAV